MQFCVYYACIFVYVYIEEWSSVYKVWRGNLREIDNVEDLNIDGMIILRWILRKWDGGVDWFDLAQDRDRWQALVNMIMIFWVP